MLNQLFLMEVKDMKKLGEFRTEQFLHGSETQASQGISMRQRHHPPTKTALEDIILRAQLLRLQHSLITAEGTLHRVLLQNVHQVRPKPSSKAQ